MHELSVTQSLLQIALRHAGGRRVTDLYIVVGQLSSFVDDSVQFYWDIISANTPAEGAKLHFRRVPAELVCRDCGERYRLGTEDFTCPTCGGGSVQIVSGDEFSLEAIDVETSDLTDKEIESAAHSRGGKDSERQ